MTGRFARTAFLIPLGAALIARADPASDESSATQNGAVERTVTQGPVTLTERLDHTQINVAQRVHLLLRASVPDGYALTMPSPGEKLGGFSIVESSNQPPALLYGRLVREVAFTLEPFLPGEYSIPAFEIGYQRQSGGANGSAKTEPVTIRVAALVQDDAKLDPGPIRGVIAPERVGSWAAPILGAIAGAGLISGAGIVAYRRHRKRPGGPTVAEQLELLGAQTERAEVSIREACDRGASLARRAAADRLPGAGAMTTEQLLVGAGALGLTSHEIDGLRDFLVRCDEVRFAGASADAPQLARELKSLSCIATAMAGPAGGHRP
jgi:hypothetical protein